MHLFTLGHSTRSLEEFQAILQGAGVRRLWDVRRYPGSRRYPHFSRDALEQSLPAIGIAYEHVAELGGRRKPQPDSPNRAWKNASFRAYADHMATDEFQAAIERLEAAAAREPLVIVCAEALPFRCHRRLIADLLVARGWEVTHLLGPKRREPHRLNPDASLLDDGRLVYPGS